VTLLNNFLALNFMNNISKLPHQSISIFSKMSQMAQEHGAINLAQGFPDFNCDENLFTMVYEAMKAGHNQYAPMPGVPALREEIKKLVKHCYGVDYDTNTEITVTSGATQAIYNVIAAMIKPGDEVIVIEPSYDSYAPAIRLQGGIPKFIELNPDFSMNWEQIRLAVNSHTKLLIINSPHNPTGSVINEVDIKELKRLLSTTDIFVLSDEVYEHIIFDGLKHLSLCSIPEIKERAFIVSSFGKTLHTTGWKMGYCLAPEYLSKEVRKVHQFNVFSSNTPIQHAYAQYLTRSYDKIEELKHFYQDLRDYMRKQLSKTDFKVLPCYGSYFINISYAHLSSMPDLEVAEKLTKNNKVATIPNSAFYHQKNYTGTLRLCFAKQNFNCTFKSDRVFP
jgi:methionine transaminase